MKEGTELERTIQVQRARVEAIYEPPGVMECLARLFIGGTKYVVDAEYAVSVDKETKETGVNVEIWAGNARLTQIFTFDRAGELSSVLYIKLLSNGVLPGKASFEAVGGVGATFLIKEADGTFEVKQHFRADPDRLDRWNKEFRRALGKRVWHRKAT